MFQLKERETFNFPKLLEQSETVGQSFEDPILYYDQQGKYQLEAVARRFTDDRYHMGVRIRRAHQFGISRKYGFSTRLIDMVVQCDPQGYVTGLDEKKIYGFQDKGDVEEEDTDETIIYKASSLRPAIATHRSINIFDIRVNYNRFPRNVNWVDTLKMYLGGKTPDGHNLSAESIYTNPLLRAK